MTNKKNWLGILVMALVCGMTVVGFNGCSKNTDPLNGTWIFNEENPEISQRGGAFSRVIFENGNFEHRFLDDDSVYYKGTYITNDGVIILTITHHRLGSLELKELQEPIRYGNKYSITDGKLTLNNRSQVPNPDFPDSDRMLRPMEFSNIFRAVETLEFIRDEKYRKPANSVSAKKSSGRVSAFPGRWHLIEGDGDAENVELFKDGTGTADGNGITWKIENGRFHILHPWYTFSAIYNVTGSTITFTQENGEVIKYQKK
jgi:uncharacterized cupin superfamily protein